MKYLKLILPFFLLMSCSGNIHSIKTNINDEINPSLKSEINLLKIELIDCIKKQDYNQIKELLSPELLELKEFNLELLVEQIFPIISNYNFIIKDQYYSVMKTVDTDSKATIVPSVSDDKLIINNLEFYNNESYNLFLTSENPGREYLFFLSMSKYNEDWKINIIHFGNYGINGLHPSELYDISNQLISNGKPLSAIFYALAMNKFLRPAPYLQYKEEAIYKEFIDTSISEMNDKMNFPINISNIKIFGMNYELTNKDGIIPVIQYITKTELDGSKIEPELKILLADILKLLDGLENDFPVMIMRAYNELPSDPNKKYKVYNTVLTMNNK